jgi:hypothetical protein
MFHVEAGLRSGPVTVILTWAKVPLCIGGTWVRRFSRHVREGLLLI